MPGNYRNRWVVLLAVVGFTLIWAGGLSAAAPPRRNRPANGTQNQNQNQTNRGRRTQGPQTQPDPVDEIAIALDQLHTAQAKLDQLVNRLHIEFQASEPYLARQHDAVVASDLYDKTRQMVLKQLASTPDYQTWRTKRDAAAKAVTEGCNSEESWSTLANQAAESLKAASACSRLESAALDAEPSVAAAHAKLTEARAAVAVLVTQFTDGLKDNTDYPPLTQAVDDARKKWQALRTAEK